MPTNRNGNRPDSDMPVVSRTRSRRRGASVGPDLRTARQVPHPAADMEPQHQARRATPATAPEGTAWEEFLASLDPVFQEVGDKVRVLDRAGWVKIENPNTGHKLYFNKGVTGVTRVESSLPPGSVKGDAPPEFYNGRITSIIPATVQAVAEAIRLIAEGEERLAMPRRRTRDIG